LDDIKELLAINLTVSAAKEEEFKGMDMPPEFLKVVKSRKDLTFTTLQLVITSLHLIK
jgi:hypothetical protein